VPARFRARVVFLIIRNNPVLIRQALDAGALGYVLKVAAGEELVPAVHAALRGARHVALSNGLDAR
jgi:DNA-binding NarL/FixJ family response regulator